MLHQFLGQLETLRPGDGNFVLPEMEAQYRIGPMAERARVFEHGFVHAGALSALVDNACGFAAMTLMPKGTGVLTVEFKMNLMSPGKGERFIGLGRVIRPGKTIMVTLGECFAEEAGERKLIAMMTATMMVVTTPGIVD